MKARATTIRIAFASLITGSIAISSTAYATVTNHSGTICKNYNAKEVKRIDYLASGTRSIHRRDTQIICPLIRGTTKNNGATVYVDLEHSRRKTTTCTAYSYNRQGQLLASKTDQWTGQGFHELVLNLRGSSKSNRWSDYSVLCKIPGKRRGIIMGIDLDE